MVLTNDAINIGQNCAFIMSKYSIRAMPGGIKKNPIFDIRKFAIPFIFSYFTTPVLSRVHSKIIPIMLEGNLIPVSITTTSPTARHANIIRH